MGSEQKPDISVAMGDLLAFLRAGEPEDETSTETEDAEAFFLSQISDQAGIVYEKIRNAVDNKEEHFLRRYAIRRIAKRIMWFSDDPKVITHELLRELYRGHYLPRNRVSRHTEEGVSRTIYAFLLLSRSVEQYVSAPEFLRLRKHLLDLIAGAVEDRLYVTHSEEAAVRMLARIADDTLDISGFADLDRESRALVIYSSAWRSLFAADSALLMYKLWLCEDPNWEHADTPSLQAMGKNFPAFVARAERLIAHDLGKRLIPRIRNYAVAVTVLYELLLRYGVGIENLLHNKADFDDHVRAIVIEKYKEDISRASRKAWRAITYILATKALLAVVVESLYLSVWKQSVNYVAVATNIFFHPFVLFFLTSALGAPSRKNTDRLTVLVGNIVYGKDLPKITVEPKKWSIVTDIALGAYLAVLSATFAWISLMLSRLDFHPVDIFLFILFLALVLYFGFRIRYAARRMELSGTKEGFFRSFMELLALPIVSVGRWLVIKFERLNFIAIFMDFFIELPLKLIFEFFDAFSSVLKEKKDEIYS